MVRPVATVRVRVEPDPELTRQFAPVVNTPSKCHFKLAQLRAPHSLDHSLDVHLQTRSIAASMGIYQPVRLRPPSLYNRGLHVHLQTGSITASKCISKLAQSHLPSASQTSDYSSRQVCTFMSFKCISNLPRSRPQSVHNHSLETHSILSSEHISRFTQSRSGETVPLDGRQPFSYTLPHLVWHRMGILEKVLFWLEDGERIWWDSWPLQMTQIE